MSYYYSARGWIELVGPGFDECVRLIERLREDAEPRSRRQVYLLGWTWSAEQINWTRYLNYSRDVVWEGVLLLEEVLTALVGLGYGIAGYFHIQGEDGEENYEIRLVDDGPIERKPAAPLIHEPPVGAERLLSSLHRQQMYMEITISNLTEAQLTAEGAAGQWSPKARLAYLAAWNRRAALWLEQMSRGQEITITTEFYPEEKDKLSATIRQQARSRSLEDILEEWRASFQATVAAAKQLPISSNPYHELNWATWANVEQATIENYRTHREDLASSLYP